MHDTDAYANTNTKETEVPVGTTDAEPNVPMDIHRSACMENPTEDLLLSQYPWTKSAQLVITWLPETEIDIWCNKTKQYWEPPSPDGPTETDIKPVIVHTRGYGLRSKGSNKNPLDSAPSVDAANKCVKREPSPVLNGPSMDKLIEHTNALIDRAKQFVTKPVKTKNHQRSSAADSKNGNGDVGTEPTVPDVLHVGT